MLGVWTQYFLLQVYTGGVLRAGTAISCPSEHPECLVPPVLPAIICICTVHVDMESYFWCF